MLRQGDSEELIGKWFERTGKRNEIFIATKFAAIVEDGAMVVRNDPPYIREAIERSLKKLCTDTIDLYYCHRMDGNTPIEHTVKTMAELQA